MYRIALIGAGQLGSRHLQGIAKSQVDIAIEIVEPYESSRKMAEQRYHEIEKNIHVKNIQFMESLDSLSDQLDIVIIATNADVRLNIVKELLSIKKVNKLILEKVLFQTVEAYYEVEDLLSQTQTECWVNHPRRMFPFYQNLKKELEKAKQINYTVQGGDWGIGCNGLHFIDHLAFLSEKEDLTISNNFLDPLLYQSKRANNVEFNGMINGIIGNHLFSLYSNSEYCPLTLTITSDVLSVYIDESRGFVRMARKENGWQWEEFNQKIIFFQSELTNRLIEDLILTDTCMLPTYKEAMALHIPFIETLLIHISKVSGNKMILCPIT